MSFTTDKNFDGYQDIAWEDRTYQGVPRNDDVYRELRAKGKGISGITLTAVYCDFLKRVNEKAGRKDRGVWPDHEKAAARLGMDPKTFSNAVRWLTAHGYIWEWRSPRMPTTATTRGYWITDLPAEHVALQEVLAYRYDVVLAGGGDCIDLQAVFDADIAAAIVNFEAAHPGHVATNGRIAAMLRGEAPLVGKTMEESIAGIKNATEAVDTRLKALGAQGSSVEAIKTIVTELRGAGAVVTAKDIVEGIDSGIFEHLAPIAEAPTLYLGDDYSDSDDAPDTDLAESEDQDWADWDEYAAYVPNDDEPDADTDDVGAYENVPGNVVVAPTVAPTLTLVPELIPAVIPAPVAPRAPRDWDAERAQAALALKAKSTDALAAWRAGNTPEAQRAQRHAEYYAAHPDEIRVS